MRRNPPLVALLGALLWAGCGARDGSDAGAMDGGERPDAASPDDASSGDRCTEFSPARAVGVVTDRSLDELSGVASSRTYEGALYTHNDSGGLARVYVLDAVDASVRGSITLSGVTARDWEDIAVGPGPDSDPWVYVADTGDNAARRGGTARESVVVYRFPEATVDASGSGFNEPVTPEALEMTYPGAPHDCEAIAVAPSGDIYLLTKEDTGPSTLFVARAPQATGLVLEPVTTLEVGGPLAPGSQYATAMDLSPGGTGLLVRSYDRVYLFIRGIDESWTDALSRAGVRLPVFREVQGEAIAWSSDGRGYFTISELAGPTLYAYAALNTACTPL